MTTITKDLLNSIPQITLISIIQLIENDVDVICLLLTCKQLLNLLKNKLGRGTGDGGAKSKGRGRGVLSTLPLITFKQVYLFKKMKNHNHSHGLEINSITNRMLVSKKSKLNLRLLKLQFEHATNSQLIIDDDFYKKDLNELKRINNQTEDVYVDTLKSDTEGMVIPPHCKTLSSSLTRPIFADYTRFNRLEELQIRTFFDHRIRDKTLRLPPSLKILTVPRLNQQDQLPPTLEELYIKCFRPQGYYDDMKMVNLSKYLHLVKLTIMNTHDDYFDPHSSQLHYERVLTNPNNNNNDDGNNHNNDNMFPPNLQQLCMEIHNDFKFNTPSTKFPPNLTKLKLYWGPNSNYLNDVASISDSLSSLYQLEKLSLYNIPVGLFKSINIPEGILKLYISIRSNHYTMVDNVGDITLGPRRLPATITRLKIYETTPSCNLPNDYIPPSTRKLVYAGNQRSLQFPHGLEELVLFYHKVDPAKLPSTLKSYTSPSSLSGIPTHLTSLEHLTIQSPYVSKLAPPLSLASSPPSLKSFSLLTSGMEKIDYNSFQSTSIESLGLYLDNDLSISSFFTHDDYDEDGETNSLIPSNIRKLSLYSIYDTFFKFSLNDILFNSNIDTINIVMKPVGRKERHLCTFNIRRIGSDSVLIIEQGSLYGGFINLLDTSCCLVYYPNKSSIFLECE